MKTKLLLSALLLLVFSTAFAQTPAAPVIDYGAIEADIAYHQNQFTHIMKMKENETAIAAAQRIILEQTAKVEEIERKLYNSLKEVDVVIRQGRAIIRAGEYTEKILNYIIEIDTMIIGQPALILIGNRMEQALVQRMTSLAEYLAISITGGNVNLMNSVERTRLINHVNSELSIMCGMCYGIKRQMLAAKRNGIMNEMLREYFTTLYRYQRNNRALADRIINQFHFN